MVGQLASLVPGQGVSSARGQLSERGGEGVADCGGVVAVGEVYEQQVAAVPVDEGGDRGSVAAPEDEVAFLTVQAWSGLVGS